MQYTKIMKRRNFVKQSIAGAIIAATPLALTGLVRAEGGGGTGSTSTDSTDWWVTTGTTDDSTNSTDWWSTTTSTEETTSTSSDSAMCKINFKQEYVDVKTNLQGAMVSAVCWYPVSGCDNPSTCGETSIQRTCNINSLDDELVECLNLPQATCPIKCSKAMKS
jgi:hypothetical protein